MSNRSKAHSLVRLRSLVRTLPSSRTLRARFPVLFAVAFCGGFAASAAQAATYNFFSVSGNNVPGNMASTTFTSNLNNGTIGVTHQFSSPAAVGYADNDNSLIYPSDFTQLFTGASPVQGHLAMTVYGDPNGPLPGGQINTSKVIFKLNYTGSVPDLVFGMWNTTDEVPLPAYNIQLKDQNGFIVSPLTFVTLGTPDNLGQVAGKHVMQLNTLTGDITAPTLANPSGTHTKAIFFKGIPTGTQEIIVTANLPPLNLIGDGVGYYFAEQVPEPSTWLLAICGAGGVGLIAARRRKRCRLG